MSILSTRNLPFSFLNSSPAQVAALNLWRLGVNVAFRVTPRLVQLKLKAPSKPETPPVVIFNAATDARLNRTKPQRRGARGKARSAQGALSHARDRISAFLGTELADQSEEVIPFLSPASYSPPLNLSARLLFFKSL